jgi:ATP-dependent DNA helicase RecG
MHRPTRPTLPIPAAAGLARKSITFDELFTLELGLALKRSNTKKEGGIAFKAASSKSPPFKSYDTLEKRLLGLLPFTLTAAQKRAIEEIRRDMASPHPMNRLIQGDVGSGKTMVSFIAALIAIESGFQAAIMAPTEILVEQHYLTTHAFADALGVKSVLLTSSTPRAERAKTLKARLFRRTLSSTRSGSRWWTSSTASVWYRGPRSRKRVLMKRGAEGARGLWKEWKA